MNTIKSTVTSIWDNVKSAVSNTIGGIYDTIKGGFDKAVNFVKGLASDAFNWGKDIISGIVDGIIKSKKVVANAVSGVADTMKLSLSSELNYKMDGMTGAIMNGSAENSVVNNYFNNDNSRTVNQTNNSPKSLSRLEIYRMTKNALS